MPFFKSLGSIVPQLLAPDNAVDTLKNNSEAWKAYEETEHDKKVYSERAKFPDSGHTHKPQFYMSDSDDE